MITKISPFIACLSGLLFISGCSSKHSHNKQTSCEDVTKHPFYIVVVDGVECGICERECLTKLHEHKYIKNCAVMHRDYENSRIMIAIKKHGRLREETLYTIIKDTGFECAHIETSENLKNA